MTDRETDTISTASTMMNHWKKLPTSTKSYLGPLGVDCVPWDVVVVVELPPEVPVVLLAGPVPPSDEESAPPVAPSGVFAELFSASIWMSSMRSISASISPGGDGVSAGDASGLRSEGELPRGGFCMMKKIFAGQKD